MRANGPLVVVCGMLSFSQMCFAADASWTAVSTLEKGTYRTVEEASLTGESTSRARLLKYAVPARQRFVHRRSKAIATRRLRQSRRLRTTRTESSTSSSNQAAVLGLFTLPIHSTPAGGSSRQEERAAEVSCSDGECWLSQSRADRPSRRRSRRPCARSFGQISS